MESTLNEGIKALKLKEKKAHGHWLGQLIGMMAFSVREPILRRQVENTPLYPIKLEDKRVPDMKLLVQVEQLAILEIVDDSDAYHGKGESRGELLQALVVDDPIRGPGLVYRLPGEDKIRFQHVGHISFAYSFYTRELRYGSEVLSHSAIELLTADNPNHPLATMLKMLFDRQVSTDTIDQYRERQIPVSTEQFIDSKSLVLGLRKQPDQKQSRLVQSLFPDTKKTPREDIVDTKTNGNRKRDTEMRKPSSIDSDKPEVKKGKADTKGVPSRTVGLYGLDAFDIEHGKELFGSVEAMPLPYRETDPVLLERVQYNFADREGNFVLSKTYAWILSWFETLPEDADTQEHQWMFNYFAYYAINNLPGELVRDGRAGDHIYDRLSEIHQMYLDRDESTPLTPDLQQSLVILERYKSIGVAIKELKVFNRDHTIAKQKVFEPFVVQVPDPEDESKPELVYLNIGYTYGDSYPNETMIWYLHDLSFNTYWDRRDTGEPLVLPYREPAQVREQLLPHFVDRYGRFSPTRVYDWVTSRLSVEKKDDYDRYIVERQALTCYAVNNLPLEMTEIERARGNMMQRVNFTSTIRSGLKSVGIHEAFLIGTPDEAWNTRGILNFGSELSAEKQHNIPMPYRIAEDDLRHDFQSQFLNELGGFDAKSSHEWIIRQIGESPIGDGKQRSQWVRRFKALAFYVINNLPVTVLEKEERVGSVYGKICASAGIKQAMDNVDFHNRFLHEGFSSEEISPEAQLLEVAHTCNQSTSKWDRIQAFNGNRHRYYQNSHIPTDPIDAFAIGSGLTALAMRGTIEMPREVVDIGGGTGTAALGIGFGGGFNVTAIEQVPMLADMAKENVTEVMSRGVRIRPDQINVIEGRVDPKNNTPEITEVLGRADVMYSYPWPEEVNSILETYMNYGKDGSLLVVYTRGFDEWYLYDDKIDEIRKKYGTDWEIEVIDIDPNYPHRRSNPYDHLLGLPSNYRVSSYWGQYCIIRKKAKPKELAAATD